MDKYLFSILQGQLLVDHSTSEYAPTAQLVKSTEMRQNVKDSSCFVSDYIIVSFFIY